MIISFIKYSSKCKQVRPLTKLKPLARNRAETEPVGCSLLISFFMKKQRNQINWYCFEYTFDSMSHIGALFDL